MLIFAMIFWVNRMIESTPFKLGTC